MTNTCVYMTHEYRVCHLFYLAIFCFVILTFSSVYFLFTIQWVVYSCNRAKNPVTQVSVFSISQTERYKQKPEVLHRKSQNKMNKRFFFFFAYRFCFCILIFLNIFPQLLCWMLFYFSRNWPRVFDAGNSVSMWGVCTEALSREST